MLAGVQELWDYKDFVREYTLQQLRTRYRGSVLGFLWTLLNPLLLCSSLTVVFAVINHWNLRTAGVYFFSGYVPWLFFANTTTMAPSVILVNASYVSRIRSPRLAFPIACVLVNLIDLLVGLVITALLMVLLSVPLASPLLSLPVAIMLFTLFVIGVTLLFATVGTMLRDFAFLWSSLSFLLFFFTPILYPITQIPPEYRGWLELNPVLPFIRLFQLPISSAAWPPAVVLVQASVIAAVSLIAGLAVFSKAQKSLYLYL